ncbi:ankyrin repeat-containing protein [Aspergillus bombycis]|uniref:Ankyrin repeat-containing protein n=1 Tax=Aspergillus bombycis TaxID=109264 RepID=A0A1F8AGZ9_9EURO|nr:ankyrin repeat-containing protein [Aspergillus bombycis]OGM50625.1 ankyrin repeat-containing protein [Aspergillus bombycis]
MGRATILKLLIEHSPKEQLEPAAARAFKCAACNGRKDVMEILINGVENVNFQIENGQSVLLSTSPKGYRGIAKQLLTKDGIDAGWEDDDGRTMLNITVDREDPHNPRGCEVVFESCNGERRESLSELPKINLVGGPRKLPESRWRSQTDEDEQTMLHLLAWESSELLTRLVLQNACLPLEQEDRYGYTPLVSAAESGHGLMVKLLLARAVKPSLPNCLAALLTAVMSEHPPIVELLLG